MRVRVRVRVEGVEGGGSCLHKGGTEGGESGDLVEEGERGAW